MPGHFVMVTLHSTYSTTLDMLDFLHLHYIHPQVRRCSPSEDADARERLIKAHFTERINKTTSQLRYADSKAVHFHAEVGCPLFGWHLYLRTILTFITPSFLSDFFQYVLLTYHTGILDNCVTHTGASFAQAFAVVGETEENGRRRGNHEQSDGS